MSDLVAFLPVLGLTIDAVGASIIVLPDIAPFKRHLLWTEELREVRGVRDKVKDGGSFLRDEGGYNILMDIIHDEIGKTSAPYEVNIHIPDHPSDGGALRFVFEEEAGSTSRLRGSLATDGNGDFITTTRVVSWLERDIEQTQNELRQHYLRVGVILLAIGFAIQAISSASSSLHYLVLALATSVVPFLFFHIVLDQELNKV